MLLARVALPLLAASSPRAGAPSCVATTMELYDPAARDAKYEGNVAQYLVDLHDSKSTFARASDRGMGMVHTQARPDM